MNNWRLLLLAVIAVLQPIGSFTESNLIDGSQELCDHRSSTVTQDTRLYGTYRKTIPEERCLSIREDIRKERRHDARNDPITRSRVRLTLERADRRISPESTVRFSAENRFASDQERRQGVSFDTRESRQTGREDQSRRTREDNSRDSVRHYERDVLDSRRIRMSQDATRAGRIDNKQVYRDSLIARDARRVRTSEDLRRVSTNRKTILGRERNEIAGDAVRRDSRINAFSAGTTLELENNRESRTFDRRARDEASENRRFRSLDSRVRSIIDRDDFRSRIDTREDHRSNFKAFSEQVDERRQQDHNRESRDRHSTLLRDSTEKMSTGHRRESIERVDRSRRDNREHRNKQIIDERRLQRDENRMSQERSSILRQSRLSISPERRQALARESRNLDAKVPSERIMMSNDRINARREVSRARTTERRQESRVSRTLEATVRDERLVRTDERRDERQQPSTRSLDRASVSRFTRDSRFIELQHNSRDSERNAINKEAARYRGDVRSAERLDQQRAQRDVSRILRERRISTLRESRDNAERRQESRSSERESITRGDMQSNERSDVNRREREERGESQEQILRLRVRDTERRHDRELSRNSRFAERAASDQRVSRIQEEIRHVVNRETRDANRASRDRTVVEQRLTRDVSASQRRTLGVAEANAQLQRDRTLKDSRDERREVRERDENRASRNRISVTVSRERIEGQRREARRNIRDSRVDARNEIIRNRGDIRMGERFEVSRRQDERRSEDRVSMQRQSRDVLAARTVEHRTREVEMNIRSERLMGSRDDRRFNERDVPNTDLRTMENRRESRRLVERQIQMNRHDMAMERTVRTDNRANRDIEAKLSSSRKDTRTDTRREAIDTRFRNFESKNREINSVDETSDNQNTMNWQMVFYTLQGAYLCGLLMQMLTEKSNKGKSRNFTWWVTSHKDLLKVD